MKKNGYTMVELIVLIVVLGIATFIVIGKTSYSFKDNTDELYKDDIKLILHQSREYGKSVESLKEKEEMVITVSDLIESGYLAATDDNYLTSTGKSLNDMKIKITYDIEKDEYDAEIYD